MAAVGAGSLWSKCGCSRSLNKYHKYSGYFNRCSKSFCDKIDDVTKTGPTARDPAPYFFDAKIQTILKRLTGLDLQKIFSVQPRRRFEPPRYEFMTEEQLQTAMADAKQRAEERLQMPPVLSARKPINEVLAYDPELKGLDSAKFVFVDISHGVSDRQRTIVVRDPDGTLRKASWEERDRMTEIFFPRIKRKLGLPKMFLEENLMEVLNNENYEFALDRACVQFEPDDPIFIKVCHQVYDHIDKHKKYDILLSTRHYGPMVFYFAFYKNIDNMLLHLFQKDRLDKAADVVRLYQYLNPDCKSAAITSVDSELHLIKIYTEKDSKKRANLELAIQTYEELQQQQKEYIKGVKEAHGHL